MKGNRLYKCEKLCSKRSIDALFTGGESKGAIVYPLRAVYRTVNREGHYIDLPADCAAQFLINVPKKKFKHAVDRVLMRRRIRESYRLNRSVLTESLLADDKSMIVEVAFMYLSDKKKPYSTIEERMQILLNKIKDDIFSTKNIESAE